MLHARNDTNTYTHIFAYNALSTKYTFVRTGVIVVFVLFLFLFLSHSLMIALIQTHLQKGSTLLCHDDELEGRRVAYIFYLVPRDWSKVFACVHVCMWVCMCACVRMYV